MSRFSSPMPQRAASDCPGPARGAPVDCTTCRIRHLSVCAALGDEEVSALEAVVSSLHLQPNSTLVREGDPRRQVYSVTAGALRLVRLLPDGRRQVAGFLLPGDFLGLSTAETHRHDVEAVTETMLCRFRAEDMQALRERFPDLERKLLSRAMTELDAARETALGLARLNPIERLAAFLLDLSEKRARWGRTEQLMVLPMGRADIADHLGLTVETVSRSFTRLRHDGVIALHDIHGVELLDRKRLVDLAAGRG
ncbi:helix-turn-helix domain-containing protein [Coralloluteibacterium thermophilus]|uniref:CRP-like protein Clp n=1 Tax=Coralloluteibacterium thermophilum TaxID=2707049 RepID=A0ABV9NKN4_9GAMM